MKSSLFYSDAYRQVEQRTLELLKAERGVLSQSIANSPRAVGDAVQRIIEQRFPQALGGLASYYTADFARRAIGDLFFSDTHGMDYQVDVKTHREDTTFNMPNLTSVQRLAQLYQSDKNVFAILLVTYRISDIDLMVSSVRFFPIEFIGWESLTIGALGWGQIQITNTNELSVYPQSRRDWMLALCDKLGVFYPAEIAKIQKRIQYFVGVQNEWLTKMDIWT